MHENKHTYQAACIAFKENESLINSDEESNIEKLNEYYLRLIIQMFHRSNTFDDIYMIDGDDVYQ